jgi:GNAT superfamily N-acetyltransferase
MSAWTEDRIWEAVDAWRWIPPESKRVVDRDFELAITPGSYALTYAYGLHAKDGPSAEVALARMEKQVRDLGGTGVRIQVDPRTHPNDLPERLGRRGYKVAEEAEALAWELVDENGAPRLPGFRSTPGVTVREVLAEPEYDAFRNLSLPIFGEPAPPEETLRALRKEFTRQLQEEGNSNYFVAWEGPSPVGRAGLEVVGEVARLWGTGVLPQHRRRGVYGQLVRARCEEALRRKATLALTTARVGTSGPILKHHGFNPVGSIRVFEARW